MKTNKEKETSFPASPPAYGDIPEDWLLLYETYDPAQETTREALTATGNGYFCIRGAAEWEDVSDAHYPGNYMHGGYNRAVTIMGGRPVSNEDLVNLPNWTGLKLSIEGEDPFSLDHEKILSYAHAFDIRTALLIRDVRFEDSKGRITHLRSRRFVSMQKMHLGAIEWTITPENWSGRAEIIASLDSRVTNWGVPVYRHYESRHLRFVRTENVGVDGISLLARTAQSRISIAQAARLRVFDGANELTLPRQDYKQDNYIQQSVTCEMVQGKALRIEKMVAQYSSKDHAITEPLSNAQRASLRFCDFETALDRHRESWRNLWALCDFRVPADPEAQRLLRFNACHVLMCCSPMTGDLDAAAPARGLTGEHYHGRIFWDEMYIYPFLNYRLPEITRGLLMYRYRRLDEARERARESGYDGAMFPWQSGSDGREETHESNYNWKDGKWYPDHSHHQRHVNAAIFYNMWQYFQATRDVDFMWNHGARMMLEIARFWASITHYNDSRKRYEIHGVVGPDEYHEKYSDAAEEVGLKNNAYTNFMVAWIFKTVADVLELFPEKRRKRLCSMLQLTPEELDRWEDISRTMFIPFHEDGIISQFEGYEDLEELDWESYRKTYGNLHRLDFILRAEGDSAYRYKLAKQADALMIFFLFSEREVRDIFERLGYAYPSGTRAKNVSYYYDRCSHCSTLSHVVHAGLMATSNPVHAWEKFVYALRADLDDIQGGTAREGIHMGIMAGALYLIQRSFLGMSVNDETLCFNPKPIPQLEGLSFRMVFRNVPLKISIENSTLTVTVEPGETIQSVTVCIGDDIHLIESGLSCSFNLERRKVAR